MKIFVNKSFYEIYENIQNYIENIEFKLDIQSNMEYQKIIDKYYPDGSRMREIYMCHCRSVSNLALEINKRLNLGLDPSEVEEAAMLHDIGIFLTFSPKIDCHGDEAYIFHGPLGAQLLRSLGVSDKIADVAERHTGAGITIEDIDSQNLPLDRRDYSPRTTLEKLICYADKFFSKSGSLERKTLEQVRQSMAKISANTLRRFEILQAEFGENDEDADKKSD